MATLDELRESLQTTNIAALIQKRIDPRLADLKRVEEPLKNALPVQTWDTSTYYFNQVTAFPTAQATTEAPPTSGAGSVSPTQSTYVQKSFPIAHAQVNGDIGKFAIKTAHASVENLLELELRRSNQALAWFEAMMHIYGSAAGTVNSVRPQWDGIDRQMASGNIIAVNAGFGNTVALADLDNLIDTVRVRIAAPLPDSDFFFLLSQPMLSELGRLHVSNERLIQTVRMAPRRDDGVAGHPVAEIEGGIEVASYRGIPLVATSFLTPQSQMGALTLGASGTGSALGTATYHVCVEAVTQYGRTYASADNSQAVTAGQNITISFSTPTANDWLGVSQPVLQYRVYAGASATTMSLRAIVPGTDDLDNAVTSITDTGATVLANGRTQCGGLVLGATASVTTANAGDGKNVAAAVAPAAGYVEDLYLVSRNPDFVTVPTVTEVESQILAPVNIRTVQYALASDKCFAMRAPQFAAKLNGAKTT